MPPTPLVSIITPTYQRDSFLPGIRQCVQSQTLQDYEWLIADDSAEKSAHFGEPGDPRIHYIHLPQKLSVGEKRNLLVERARSEVILQFDDDDYYAPGYAHTMLNALNSGGHDLMNLRAWFLFDQRHRFFGFWDLMLKDGLHFALGRERAELMMFDSKTDDSFKDNHLGFGFGWIYRKAVWARAPFPHVDWNEDGAFALNAQAHFRLGGHLDTRGICLHILHGGNCSRVFPQFQLPLFMLEQYFPQMDKQRYLNV
jgi:glycosyltransferase involved in cell wall biosynthesis